VTGFRVAPLDGEHRRTVGELMGIGSADPHRSDLDQEFALGHHGAGYILDSDVTSPVKHRSPHS
jgi:hypothetical protein